MKEKILKNKDKSQIIKKITDKLFKELNVNDFNSINIKFDLEDKEYVKASFNIQETPDWLYGIWWDKNFISNDNNYEIDGIFFAQYEDEINKFEPSDSFIIEKINSIYETKKDEINVTFNDINNLLRNLIYIQSYPELAWYRDMHFCDYNYEYVDRRDAMNEYIKYLKAIKYQVNEGNKCTSKILDYCFEVAKKKYVNFSIIEKKENVIPKYTIIAYDGMSKSEKKELFENEYEKNEFQRLCNAYKSRMNKPYVIWEIPIGNEVIIYDKKSYEKNVHNSDVYRSL